MQRTYQNIWLALMGSVLAATASAQTGATMVVVTTNIQVKFTSISTTNRQLSPVEYFRVLLTMPAAEQERALAKQSPRQRAVILAKLKEYNLLSPAERELRLHQTELHWDLLEAMKTPPTQREPRLSALAPGERKLVETRLVLWDKLSAEAQSQFLENEKAVSIWLHWQTSAPPAPPGVRVSMNVHSRELDAELKRWEALPPEQRTQISDQFRQFFDLDEEDKEKTLNRLSEPERRKMEQTLKNFASLSADQRRTCIQSFQKFVNMTSYERDQFLQNAARWEAMTATERKAWSDLVNKLPQLPPLPPGMKLNEAPVPPGFPTLSSNQSPVPSPTLEARTGLGN